MNLETEIAELLAFHHGLVKAKGEECAPIVIQGVLNFNASYDGLESIQDWFEIELKIPAEYPKILPVVTELQGKVASNYEHLNGDGTFCLAVPIAERLAFQKEPSLLGFVKNLVVSYLYSYCYWQIHEEYPFDDSPHGISGFLDYYKKQFGTDLSPELFSGIKRIVKHGYRGHHPCPCGSGKRVRNCHKQLVMDLSSQEIRPLLGLEVKEIEKALSKRNYRSET